MPGRSAASAAPFANSILRERTIDGRTLVARRRRALIDIYVKAFGGKDSVSETKLIGIRKAAELTALAEQARAQAMRESTIAMGDLADVIKLENAAGRAVRELNLPKKDEHKRPTMADFLARKAAEKAAGTSSASLPSDDGAPTSNAPVPSGAIEA